MININLLPPESKLKIRLAKQSANVFSICLVIILLIIVITVILAAVKNDLLSPELENINNNISQQGSQTKSLDQLEQKALFLNDRAKTATSIENQKANWSEIIQDLINSTPQDAKLVNLSADLAKSPNFVLQGATTSEREAIKFKEKLENSKFFKDVSFKSSSTTNDAAEGALNFTLEFNLESRSLLKVTDKETTK